MKRSTAAVLVTALVACGPRTEDDANPNAPDAAPVTGLVSIEVMPADATLVIDGAPASQAYTAIGHFDEGEPRDITGQVSFSILDSTLGRFEGPALTSVGERGGRSTVVATVAGVRGSTGVTFVLRKRHFDPASDLPADPAPVFDGPGDAARAPRLVYPNDGVVVPPNLRRLEFHFYPGAGNGLFELSFRNAVTDVAVYLRCTFPRAGGCIYQPDADLWRWISETNRGGEPVAVRVRGTDDQGSGVGTSASLDLAISFEGLRGGIYYWTTSGGTGIMRFDFGDATQTEATRFVGTEKSEGLCVGCHALSRDGRKIVAAAGGQDDGRILLMDVASESLLVPFGTPPKSMFESWSPDGSRYVGVYADAGATNFNLLLFDGDSGASLGHIDVGATAANPADHPDWSADGQHIAFTRMGIPGTNQRMFKGAIEVITDEGGTWSAPRVVVPSLAGRNRYYPAISPDGGLIAFNESVCPVSEAHPSCDADTDPTAMLHIVSLAPGATPIALAAANAPGELDAGQTALTNSYPKWNPFVFQRDGELGERVEWLTFSSMRRYGLRGPPVAGGSLLWMTAIDPDRAGAGQDPSSPAFVLPFQDLETSNHIAQWTEEIVVVE